MSVSLRRTAASLLQPDLSTFPVIALAAWAAQMGYWRWGNSITDWRSWVGWLGGWIGAYMLQRIINRVRRRKAVVA